MPLFSFLLQEIAASYDVVDGPNDEGATNDDHTVKRFFVEKLVERAEETNGKSKVDEMDVVYGLLLFTQLQMQDSNSQIPQH